MRGFGWFSSFLQMGHDPAKPCRFCGETLTIEQGRCWYSDFVMTCERYRALHPKEFEEEE